MYLKLGKEQQVVFPLFSLGRVKIQWKNSKLFVHFVVKLFLSFFTLFLYISWIYTLFHKGKFNIFFFIIIKAGCLISSLIWHERVGEEITFLIS